MKKEQVQIKHEKNTTPTSATPKESQEDQERALRIAKFRKMFKKYGLPC